MVGSENSNGMVMPVGPVGNNCGGFGGDWGSWIILFLIFGMFNGNGWGNNNGNGQFPWLMNATQNTDNAIQAGFANASMSSKLDEIQGNQYNGTIETLKTNYQNQINSMNQRFADTIALNNQMYGLTSGLQNCCCENRQSIANLKAELTAEMAAGFQSIKDDLCQTKIEAKNDKIADLQQQLYFANLKASQNDQTSRIEAGQRALASEIEQYVMPTARPAYIVQNPNCCQPGYNCGYAA